jgi:hypothetical protein
MVAGAELRHAEIVKDGHLLGRQIKRRAIGLRGHSPSLTLVARLAERVPAAPVRRLESNSLQQAVFRLRVPSLDQEHGAGGDERLGPDRGRRRLVLIGSPRMGQGRVVLAEQSLGLAQASHGRGIARLLQQQRAVEVAGLCRTASAEGGEGPRLQRRRVGGRYSRGTGRRRRPGGTSGEGQAPESAPAPAGLRAPSRPTCLRLQASTLKSDRSPAASSHPYPASPAVIMVEKRIFFVVVVSNSLPKS